MLPDLLHSLASNVWTTFLVVLFFGGSIFVHELGHFLAARRRGVRVERFSIGFGPAIWSRRGRDGVEYRISWIPLGGYVLLPQLADLGPIEGAVETDASRLPPVGYASKMIVFSAGVIFNLLFAFALACVIWVVGQPESSEFATTRIGYVSATIDMPDGSKAPSPAANAGLRVGDVVRTIDGKKVANWYDLQELLNTGTGRNQQDQPRAVISLERGGRPLDVVVLPLLAGDEKLRRIGIAPAFDLIVYQVAPNSPAAQAGFEPGDQIQQFNGAPMLNNTAFGEALDATRTKTTSALVNRAGKETALTIPARPAPSAAEPGADFGLTFSLGIHMTYPSPVAQIRDEVVTTFRTLWSLLNPHSDVGLSKLAGPIGIVRILSSAAETGLRSVFMFTILVNVNLAILNLLPIPVLDGGQILFATIGRIRGRALPQNFIMTTQSVFMILLFSMILYVSYFDVRRWARDMQSDRTAASEVQKP